MTHRPDLKHGVLGFFTIKFGFQNDVVDGIIASRCYVSYGTFASRWHDHSVLDQSILVDYAVNVATSNVTANLDELRIKFPSYAARQTGYVDTLGYVNRIRELVDVFQWTLYTVEDTTKYTRSQFNG